MLTGVDLDLVTAKTVRRSLEDHFKMDLSDRKKEIGGIINEILNSEVLNGNPPQKPAVKKEQVVKKEPLVQKEQPVKKEEQLIKKAEERTDVKSERSEVKSERPAEEDDAELARRLQAEEETGGKRATRQSGRHTGQKRKSDNHSKKKKKTKSKEQASDSTNSEASGSDSDSGGKDRKKVKKTTKGGYLVSVVLAES